MQIPPVILVVFSLLLVLSVSLSAWVFWQIRAINRLRKNLFTGVSGQDLENALGQLAENLATLQDNQLILQNRLKDLGRQLDLAVQKTGIVRFNPFADGGGNFSFSLALLDSRDCGLVITSMHGREQSRVYAKRLQSGVSDITLTEEENQAVNQARGGQNATRANQT